MRAISGKHKGRLAAGMIAVAFFGAPAGAADSRAVPDFSGRWGRNAFDYERLPTGPIPIVNMRRVGKDAARPILGGGESLPLMGDWHNPNLKPEAAEVLRKRGLISLGGENFPDPSNQCYPFQPPYASTIQLALEMLQTGNEIVILYNQDDQVRHIHMNAPHPAHVTPSAMGDSVGHYEGDTLVIDTIGVETGPLAMIDRYGTPFSDRLHLVERYHLIDAKEAQADIKRHEAVAGRIGGPPGAIPVVLDYPKALRLDLTVDDPGVFYKPWSAQVTYLRSTLPWNEVVCAENHAEYYLGKDTAIPTAAKPDF
jgi:hypothetical protein